MKHRILALFVALCLFLCVLPASYAVEYSPEQQLNILQDIADRIRYDGLYSSEEDDPLADALLTQLEADPALFDRIAAKEFPAIDDGAEEKMRALIEEARLDCDSVGGVIAAAEYTNGTDTLTYQVSSSSLVNEPTLGSRTEKETFFSGTEQQFVVTLPYNQGDTIRADAQWEIDGTYYRLTCTGEVSREQILTLAREFCSWMESAE